jgi:hypothetical protein
MREELWSALQHRGSSGEELDEHFKLEVAKSLSWKQVGIISGLFCGLRETEGRLFLLPLPRPLLFDSYGEL